MNQLESHFTNFPSDTAKVHIGQSKLFLKNSRKGVSKLKSCAKCLEYPTVELKYTKKSNNLLSSELCALMTKLAKTNPRESLLVRNFVVNEGWFLAYW